VRALRDACSSQVHLPGVRPVRDRGSVAVEMVLLTPVLVVMMVFVVFLGRAGGASQQVRHAADAAARAASMVSPARMQAAAHATATADLSANGVNCASTSVSVSLTAGAESGQVAVSSVTVTVHCTTDSQGLGLLRVGARTLTAMSTELVDEHRGGA
ncbi:MAG TPA: TadE/TadG family type IV pilus assembly protein, partial [Ilumatobacteraceae bacterium]|nr:TadE/TadG family type IV pilus assembly protein [Ilumatobacteraceae bacterium]